MKTYLVAYITVDGKPDSVETPVIGNAEQERRNLNKLIAEKYPNATPGSILKVGTKFDTREDNAPGPIELAPGQTLRQLFIDADGVEIGFRDIGRVFFSGEPYVLGITFSKSSASVGVKLVPVLPHGGSLNFTNQINPQRAVTELAGIVSEVLGKEAKDLVLNFREVKA